MAESTLQRLLRDGLATVIFPTDYEVGLLSAELLRVRKELAVVRAERAALQVQEDELEKLANRCEETRRTVELQIIGEVPFSIYEGNE